MGGIIVKNMLQLWRRLILIFFIPVLLLISCRRVSDPPIVSINDHNLYLNDFLYHIYLVEQDGNRMKAYYLENLGKEYWDVTYQGTTVRQIAKNSIIAGVVMYEILYNQASQKGITLNSSEQEDLEKSVESFIDNSSKKNLEDIGLTREVIETSCQKIALAEKYRKELEAGFTINETKIRDKVRQEDYQEYKTECLFIPKLIPDSKAPTLQSKKEPVSSYSMITEARNQLSKGSSFASLVNQYENLAYYTRNFVYGKDSYEKEYQDAAISLQNEEYSSVITTKLGYYIIHMLNNNSTEQYEQAIRDAIEAEKFELFKETYQQIKDQYDITINFDYWDTVEIGSVTDKAE